MGLLRFKEKVFVQLFILLFLLILNTACSTREMRQTEVNMLMSQHYKYLKENNIQKDIEILEKLSILINKREYSNAIFNTEFGSIGTHGESLLYGTLGDLYYFQSKYDIALKYYQKSKQVLKDNDRVKYISYTNNDLAKVYLQLGQYQKAINLLKYNFWTEKNYTAGKTLTKLYVKNNELKKAIKVAKEIFNTRLKQNNDTSILDCEKYNLLGDMYFFIGNYKKALQYYFYPLSIAKHRNSENYDYNNRSIYFMAKLSGRQYKDLATSQFKLGRVYYQMKNYSKAIKYLKQALVSSKSEHYIKESTKLEIKRYLAWSILEFNHYHNNNQSLTLFLEIINKKRILYGENSLSEEYYGLSTYYNTQNMTKKAYQYMKKSYDIFVKNRHQNFTILNSFEKHKYLKTKNIKVLYLFNLAYQYINKLNNTLAKNITKEAWNN